MREWQAGDVIVVSYAPTLARSVATLMTGAVKEFCMRIRPMVPGVSRMTPTIRNFATALAATLISVTSTTVSAAEQADPNTIEITPFFGLIAGGEFEEPTSGGELDIEEDTSYGIFVNVMADVPERQYELLYAKQATSIEAAAPIDLDMEYLQIGGHVAYPQSRYVVPYFGVTVGAARLSPDLAGLDDETKVSFSVGGGIRFPITKHFGIRFDTRAFITLLEDDSQIFCVSEPANAGCAIRPKSDTLVQYTGSLGVTFGF